MTIGVSSLEDAIVERLIGRGALLRPRQILWRGLRRPELDVGTGMSPRSLIRHERLGVRPQRLCGQLAVDPHGVGGVCDAIKRRVGGREIPTLSFSCGRLGNRPRQVTRDDVENGLAPARQERIEKHEATNPVMDELHSPRRNDSTVTVGDQDRVLDVLEFEYVHEILNVRAQTDVRAQQVSALAESGQGWRIDVVTGVTRRGDTRAQHQPPWRPPWRSTNGGSSLIDPSLALRYRSPYALSSCFTSAKAS